MAQRSEGYQLVNSPSIERIYETRRDGLEVEWVEGMAYVSPGSVRYWRGPSFIFHYVNDDKIALRIPPEWQGKMARVLLVADFKACVTRVVIDAADELVPTRWDDERWETLLASQRMETK